MKIFHTSDWHLGKLVNGFYMTEDQEFVMNQVYEVIEKENPDVLIIAGDLYDRSVPPVEAVELLNKVLNKIVISLKTPVIALAGNHDSNERLEFASGLLKGSGLYFSGNLKKDIEKITINDEFGIVNFYPIPYSDPQIVRYLFEDESIKTHDDAMKKIIDSIKKTMNRNERNVVIAHGYVTSINSENNITVPLEESDSEKPLSIGGTGVINVKYFEDFNYTALGHIHGPQKVSSNKIRYAGSLLKYSFSEVNQKKGITIVNMNEHGVVDIDFFEFKARRDLRVIKGKLRELISEEVSSKANREDYVKAILTDNGELLDPMAKLRSVYPNAMEVIREDRIKENNLINKISLNVKETSSIALFEKFYEDITGEKCSEEENEIIAEIIEKAENGGEG